MKGVLLILFLAFSLPADVYSQRTERLPIPYEDNGACPFECCVYREWIGTKPTVVRADKRINSPAIFTVRKGERVSAITGVVITTRAGRARMLKPDTIDGVRVTAGDLLYVLTNQGEGFYKVWYKGRMLSYGIWDNPSVKVLSPPQAVWWVEIKNRKGQIGWSNQPDNFDNKDSCAHHSLRPAERGAFRKSSLQRVLIRPPLTN